jgi:O-antigen/teichoic acid export membrane protein
MSINENEKADHLSKTKKGLKWSFVNQIGTQTISLVVSIVLARLIDPAEFGLVGMVSVFINFASIFIDFGFSSVLIQKDKVNKEDLNTVFVCNLSIGLFLYFLFFLLSPLLADFFDEPRLILITRIVSISFLIAPLNAGRSAMISKVMNFKLSTKISIFSLVVSSAVAIIMALNGFGVWSVICQSLVASSVSAIYFRIISDFKPSLRFNKDSFKSMISMSSNLVADSVINYWTRNADNLLVGKFLGSEALGIYNRSYSLMLMPLTNITRVIMRVMLPSFSMIKNNKIEIKRIYLRVCETIAAITFPMMLGLSAVADVFVLAVLGDKWQAMIPLVRVLSIVGALQSILAMNGSIYVSQGKANIAFRVTLVFNIVFLSGFIVGLYYGGLYGIALSYFITSLIGAYPNFYFAARLINVGFKDMYNKLGKIILASVLMFASVNLINYFSLFSNQQVVVKLILSTLSGIVIYLFLIYLMDIKIYFELKSKIFRKIGLNKIASS